MVADAQWAAGLTTTPDYATSPVVERRAADGRRVQMTVEELARVLGARCGEIQCDEDAG
jgi:hypothetical protein